jgi:hypothetical protein
MTITSAQVAVNVRGELISALDVGQASYPFNWTPQQTFADGSGAAQINQVWTDTRTLTASATENLDLSGVLANAFGVTLALTKLKTIVVQASSANTNNVQVTRPASNGVPLFMAASDGIALPAGGIFAAVFPDAAGVTVTASTGDILTVTNSAGSTSVTYTITLFGAA